MLPHVKGSMQSSTVAPIAYLPPAVDHWPRIFRILAIACILFGAFYAAAGAAGMRIWLYRDLRNATANANYWMPLLSPLIDLLMGASVIATAVQLLRGGPYENMIRWLRIIVFFVPVGMVMGVLRSRGNFSWPLLVYQAGGAGMRISFPLLVMLILLTHRKLHPNSPQAQKPKPPEPPLPLLRM